MESRWIGAKLTQGQLWSEEIGTQSRQSGKNHVAHRVEQEAVCQMPHACF